MSSDSVTYTTEINVKPRATFQYSDVGLEKGSLKSKRTRGKGINLKYKASYKTLF